MAESSEQSRSTVQTVFVHGLGSSSYKTWVGAPSLPEVAEEVLQTPALFFDYPTEKLRFNFFRGSKPRIENLAAGLRSFLDLSVGDSKVVLVCHSMGGLVARKMLVDLVKDDHPTAVEKLLLFGTPNDGTELAYVGKKISFRNDQLEQLRPNSSFIDQLNHDWRTLEMSNHIDTHYIVGGQDRAVPTVSARGTSSERRNITTIIGADHAGVAAPDSSEHLGAILLRAKLDELVELPDPGLNSTWISVAHSLANRGLVLQAEKAFQEACADDNLVALRGYAKFLRQVGRDEDAYNLNKYMTGLPAWLKDHSNDAVADRALVVANMGVIKRNQNDLELSESHLREAVNTVAGSGPGRLAQAEAYCRDNLGHTLLKQDRHQDALLEFELSLALRKNAGEDGPLARSHINLARQYMAQGLLTRAHESVSASITLLQKLPNERRNLAGAYICLGEVQTDHRQYAAAVLSLREGIDINEEIQNRTGSAIGWMKLGQAHRANGEREAAIQAIDRSVHINRDLGNTLRVAAAELVLAELRNSEDSED